MNRNDPIDDPTSVLVVGAGALGTVFANALAAEGLRVVLHSREPTRAALAETGELVVRMPDGAAQRSAIGDRLTLGSPEDPGGIAPDIVILATKANQLEEAITGIAAYDLDHAVALGTQNGVWKDGVIRDRFGAGAVPAATFVGGERRSPGVVDLTLAGTTFVGTHPGILPLVSALTAQGLPCEARDDAADVVWTKLVNSAAMFPISVLTRLSNPQIRGTDALMEAYLGLVREAAAIARASGRTLVDLPSIPLANVLAADPAAASGMLRGDRPATAAGARSSMLQDMLLQRPMEHEQVIGDLVRRADQLQMDAPRLRQAYQLMSGIAEYL